MKLIYVTKNTAFNHLYDETTTIYSIFVYFYIHISIIPPLRRWYDVRFHMFLFTVLTIDYYL